MLSELKEFYDMLDRIEKASKKIPRLAAIEARNFSVNRFKAQNWIGDTTQPWPKRKANRSKRKGRAILIKSGRLRRSIRIIHVDQQRAVIGTDVPYAQIHNEGFRGQETVKAHTRNLTTTSREGTGVYSIKTKRERTKRVKTISGQTQVKSFTRNMNMPKRQFIGASPFLEKKLNRLMIAQLNRAVKGNTNY